MKNLHTCLLALFVLFTLVIAMMGISVARQDFGFNTDLAALLPQTSGNRITRQADTLLTEKMGQGVVIVITASAITASDPERLHQAGKDLVEIFCTSDSSAPVECINQESSPSFGNMVKLLSDHRHYLLGEAQIDTIANNPGQLSATAMKRLYSIGQWAPVLPLNKDPLGLFDSYIQQLISGMTPFRQYHGMNILANEQGEEVGLALFARLRSDGYNLDYQKSFDAWFTARQQQFGTSHHDVELLTSGAIFHAIAAAANARQEISLISGISMAGIVILFLAGFRSLQPLLAGVFSLAFGTLSAVVACQFFLKELHLLTLVFGSSMIGVAVDYSLHFFCEKHFNGDGNRCLKGTTAISNIFPAITLGLLTTMIGYGILTQAPMPGLKQIALFSLTGLVGAWICVVALFPLLRQTPQQNPPALFVVAADSCARFWHRAGPRNSLLAALLLLSGSIASITLFATSSDSIRTLYKPDQQLLAQEQKIRTLFNGMANNQYFLLRAGSADDLLVLEQGLLAQLDVLVSKGELKGYTANRQFLPDTKTQQQNYQAYRDRVYQDGGPADRFLQQIGADSALLDSLQADVARRANQPLTLEALHAVLPEELHPLYPGVIGDEHVSLVLLRGINSLPALEQLAAGDSIRFYDKLKEISQVLHDQQRLVLQQLLLGYLLIGLMVLARYRYLGALVLVAIPALSSLVTIAALSLAGVSFSLFHGFALFLILGLGMDYAIFLFDAEGSAAASSRVAVLLSAVTTCLSFGLLGLSSTPMIAAFGVSILLGTLLNYVLAPLVVFFRQPTGRNP